MAFNPRPPVTEIFVNNTWTDISTDVRDTPGIRITRGSPDEASEEGVPSQMLLDLHNSSGNYSSRNPTGIYFGSFGKNTPIRQSLLISKDTFNRSISNGWGTNDAGDAYTHFFTGGAASSDVSVSGGTGRFLHGAANRSLSATLEGSEVAYGDLEIAATVSLPFTTVTGGLVFPIGLLLRVPAAHAAFINARVVLTTSGLFFLAVVDHLGSAVLPSVQLPLTHSSSQPIRMRAQVENRIIRAKVWQPNLTGEPAAWTQTGDFNNPASSILGLRDAFGGVGIRSQTATGNTNVPFTAQFSDVVVRNLRFTGEISDAVASWDRSEADYITSVTAGAVRRRIAQGRFAAASPSRRAISRIPGGDGIPTTSGHDIVAWWPLEDASNIIDGSAEVAVGQVAGPILTTRTTVDSIVEYGSTKGLPPGAPATVRLGAGGGLSAPVRTTITTGAAWSMAFAAKLDIGKEVLIYALTDGSIINSVAGSFYLELGMRADGTVDLNHLDPGITLMFGPSIAVELDSTAPDDGVVAGWAAQRWHHYIISARASGADLILYLNVDGIQVHTRTLAGKAIILKPVTRAMVRTHTGSANGPINIGHLLVRENYPLAWPSVAPSLSTPCLGGIGDTSAARMLRIGNEEGTPIAIFGSPAGGSIMGAQAVAKPGEIISDVIGVDMGLFYEPRGDSAIAYRTRATLYNQSPVVTLDYAAAHVTELAVKDDDQRTRNDIRATREPGGSVTYREFLALGRLSILPASNGIGPYVEQVEPNVANDFQLPSIAGWRLGRGTVDQVRYPVIGTELAKPEVALLIPGLLTADIGDVLLLQRPKNNNSPSDTRQIIEGISEHIRTLFHSISFACSPASPYDVLIIGTGATARISAHNSILSSSVTSGVTSLSVAPAASKHDQWTTAGPFSFKVVVGGEEMTVTNVTGSGTQTFTVIRSQNGVIKAHAAGTPVLLHSPAHIAY